MREYRGTISSISSGLPVYHAQVRLFANNSTTTAIQLYSDAGVTPLAQPVLTDGTGLYQFYVADGTYNLQVSDPDGTNPRNFNNTEIYEDARNVSVPVGEAAVALPSAGSRAGKLLGFGPLGGGAVPTAYNLSASALESLAAIDADIVLVADNIGSIDTVAANLTGSNTIGTVASNITNVNAVGTISAAVTTVAGIAANVTTVAGISANVTIVAGIAANVTAVAGNATNINAVATDLALGAGASYILRAPQAAIDAAASAAAAAASAAATSIPLYASAIKSAVGTGTLNALFDMDGPRTAYSSSATIMTALASLDDTPLSLGLYGTIYSGTDPRPVYTSRGIYLSSAAGFQTTSPIFTKTSGDFAFLYAMDLNTVTSTVALQSSLPGSPADGDMVLVNGDRNVRTGLGTDVKTVLDTAWTASDLVNGYFKRNNFNAVWEASTFLLKATGPSGSRFEVSITHLGQLTLFIYDGTNASSLISKGSVLMGQSKVTFGIRRKGSNIFLIVNGRVIYGVGSALVNITDLNQWYINGSSRQAAATQPVINGLRHYFKGMCVADDLTDACFKDLYDTFAHRHSTPVLVRPRAMRGIAVEGQSWTQGATTVTDSWRAGPNNWDGMVTPNNATYAQEANSVTREAFSNFFAPKDQDNPGDIAPYAVQVDASGNVTASHNIGGSGENFLAGFAKQLNQHSVGAASDFIVSGTGQGGASIAILSFQSTVPLVQQLKTIPLTGSDYYNKMLRQIVYARDFALSRGQTYTLDVMMWQQGHTDGNNAAYLTALYAVHDRFAADVKAITGQSHNPIWLSPQITYSSDGTTNGTNSGTGVIDQLFLDMEDGRGTRPMYCIGPMYQITNFIHPYRAGHRWIGEIFGRAFTQIVFDGESYGCLRPYAYTYSIGGTTIDIDYRVRAGRALTLSQTNDNNIYTVVANQGFDFTDASAGGVTISSVAVTSGTRIRVTLSGAIGAGDTIRYAGALRFGNVADGAKVNGVYPDQDWTATFVSNEPPFGNGNVNDLRQWAAASRKVL